MASEGMRGRILEWMRGGRYRPSNKSELARHLGVGSEERAQLRAELVRLEREGMIVAGKKGRYSLAEADAGRLTGILRFHPKGHAWFYPERGPGEAPAERCYVSRRDAGTALDGDRVMASVVRTGHPGRRRGRETDEEDSRVRVERVLERRSGRVVGVFRKNGKHSWVDADDPAVRGVVELEVESTALPGQWVVVELESWQGRHLSPRGRVIEVLGWPDDAGVDVMAVIHRHGLATAFPEEVLQAARAVTGEIAVGEQTRRDDWTGRLVVTIDPADAKDHDDAIHVAAVDGGGWELAVHIADVAHFVKAGGVLDEEARRRGNSTYLVDRVLPMLPPELSNGICSLKPDVERLTKCVVLRVAADGGLTPVSFRDARIRSTRKLSYEEAQEMLDGAGNDAVAVMVRDAWRMAAVLRARRFRQGALDLDFPEVRVELDDRGRPVKVAKVEHTASHQLIEECMLAANEAVAKLLRERARPAVFRVHEDPDFGKLFEFATLARSFGHEPGDLTNRKHVQKLLDEIRGQPHEHALKLGLLKSLQRAAYAANPLGHYGLAKNDYCHFTSPIRRYADLLVHRALQSLLGNPPADAEVTESYAALGAVAKHLSETERNSAEAEEETRRMKLLEYLELAGAAENPPVFEGLVTDVRTSGLLVEAVAIATRGLIKREDLPRGDWRFDAARMRYVERNGREIRLGQKVPMQVVEVHLIRGLVDFRLAEEPARKASRS